MNFDWITHFKKKNVIMTRTVLSIKFDSMHVWYTAGKSVVAITIFLGGKRWHLRNNCIFIRTSVLVHHITYVIFRNVIISKIHITAICPVVSNKKDFSWESIFIFKMMVCLQYFHFSFFSILYKYVKIISRWFQIINIIFTTING